MKMTEKKLPKPFKDLNWEEVGAVDRKMDLYNESYSSVRSKEHKYIIHFNLLIFKKHDYQYMKAKIENWTYIDSRDRSNIRVLNQIPVPDLSSHSKLNMTL